MLKVKVKEMNDQVYEQNLSSERFDDRCEFLSDAVKRDLKD